VEQSIVQNGMVKDKNATLPFFLNPPRSFRLSVRLLRKEKKTDGFFLSPEILCCRMKEAAAKVVYGSQRKKLNG
jgi:hypothetical protein